MPVDPKGHARSRPEHERDEREEVPFAGVTDGGKLFRRTAGEQAHQSASYEPRRASCSAESGAGTEVATAAVCALACWLTFTVVPAPAAGEVPAASRHGFSHPREFDLESTAWALSMRALSNWAKRWSASDVRAPHRRSWSEKLWAGHNFPAQLRIARLNALTFFDNPQLFPCFQPSFRARFDAACCDTPKRLATSQATRPGLHIRAGLFHCSDVSPGHAPPHASVRRADGRGDQVEKFLIHAVGSTACTTS